MTTSELIERLQKLPDNEVVVNFPDDPEKSQCDFTLKDVYDSVDVIVIEVN